MTPSEIQILIVDDVQTVRVQVKEVLRSCGFEKIQSASNGVEALAALKSSKFHCVISDWYMEPMSGLELLKKVREDSDLKDLAFVMLTAESTKEKVIEAIKTGLDDYVMKPFSKEHAQLKLMNALLKRKVI
jgi:two-component system chemotaxis response regulator CheY